MGNMAKDHGMSQPEKAYARDPLSAGLIAVLRDVDFI